MVYGLMDALSNVPAVTDGHSDGGAQMPAPVSSLFGQSASYAGSSAHSEPTGTGNGGGISAGSIASTILEGGLGVVPLITGLMGLFGGGSSTPAQLEKYEMPSSISFTSAESGDGLAAADFDQMGAPRVSGYGAGIEAGGSTLSPAHSGTGNLSFGGGTNPASSPITVNVQTMDARSFLDNSDQIAQAVRGAMLNLSSINDVVNELS